MARIPIHNETDYTLTETMTQQIIRDAQEHFGEEVHAIRVQSGLERHALNARTREVRYAFSPQDFGLSHPIPVVQEHSASVAALSSIDEDTEDTILPVSFADDTDVEEDEEDTEALETSLESLDEEQDDEEDDVFTLDAPEEDADEGEEDNVLDDEEENVFEDDEI